MILFLFPISNSILHSASGKPVTLLPTAETSFLNADVSSVTLGLKKNTSYYFVLIKGNLARGMLSGRESKTQKKNAHYALNVNYQMS